MLSHEKSAHTHSPRPTIEERLAVLLDALERASPGLPRKDLIKLHARWFMMHRNTRSGDLQVLLSLPNVYELGSLVCIRREAS